MELTIKMTREEYDLVTTALVNAELDAWDRSRKCKDESGKQIGQRDEEALFNFRKRLQTAYDNIAPWCEERRV